VGWTTVITSAGHASLDIFTVLPTPIDVIVEAQAHIKVNSGPVTTAEFCHYTPAGSQQCIGMVAPASPGPGFNWDDSATFNQHHPNVECFIVQTGTIVGPNPLVVSGIQLWGNGVNPFGADDCVVGTGPHVG
jgi:hypothetical protein